MKKMLLAVALGAMATTPAFAQESGDTARDGFRIEGRVTYETPTISSVEEDDDVFKIGSAFAFGGEAGFDIAVSDSAVVGPYAQYEISTVENCDLDVCVSAEGYFEAGLHVGFATSPEGQIYGKVGYAEQSYEITGFGPDVSDTGSGFAFALGYEHGFGEYFYGRIEGGYADLGDVFGINTQRRHFGVAIGSRF